MKMKLIALLTLLSLTSAYAQRPGNADRQQMREEMTEKQATRLAKDFELKDDAKTEFIKQYKAYQQELRGENRERQQRQGEVQGRPDGQKKLTDEQAKKRIERYFERQEQQIANMQRRLAVDRKYYEQFSKTLTPQQLTRIFSQQRQMQRTQGAQQRRPEGFGGPQREARQGGFGGGDMGGDF